MESAEAVTPAMRRDFDPCIQVTPLNRGTGSCGFALRVWRQEVGFEVQLFVMAKRDGQPLRSAGELQEAPKVWKLLDFGSQDCRFGYVLLAHAATDAWVVEEPATAALGNLCTDDFAVADQAAREAGRAALLA